MHTNVTHQRCLKWIVATQVAVIAVALGVGLVAYVVGVASNELVVVLAGACIGVLIATDVLESLLLKRSASKRLLDHRER